MRKYLTLGLVVLGLVGCASMSEPGPSYPQPAVGDRLTAVGHNENIEWRCQPIENNQDIIMVNCQFHRFTMARSNTDEKQACVRLSFTPPGQQPFQNNLVCSDPLTSDEHTNHIVPIQGAARFEMLPLCGTNQWCTFSVHEEAVPSTVKVKGNK